MPPTLKQTEILASTDELVHLKIRRSSPPFRILFGALALLVVGLLVAGIVLSVLRPPDDDISAFVLALFLGLVELFCLHRIFAYVIVRAGDGELLIERFPFRRTIRLRFGEIVGVRTHTRRTQDEENREYVSHVISVEPVEGASFDLQTFHDVAEARYVCQLIRHPMEGELASPRARRRLPPTVRLRTVLFVVLGLALGGLPATLIVLVSATAWAGPVLCTHDASELVYLPAGTRVGGGAPPSASHSWHCVTGTVHGDVSRQAYTFACSIGAGVAQLLFLLLYFGAKWRDARRGGT